LGRELVAAVRKRGAFRSRSTFVALLLIIFVGLFGAAYYVGGGYLGRYAINDIAIQAFAIVFVIHCALVLSATTAGGLAIAAEKDRRTLDFLLLTRLTSAEIVLGKLAACLAGLAAHVAAGIPVVLLLNVLGGINVRLLLLAYAGLWSTVLFVLAVAIWISTGAPGARRAVNVTVLSIMAWLFLPFFVATLVPRFGLPLPSFIFTINAWVLASSPVSLLLKFAGGGLAGPGAVIDAVAWMSGLQLAASVVLLAGSIARLRAAYRVNLGGDGLALGARRDRPYWRLFPRPPVGDDPILWREMHTSRSGFTGKLVGLLIGLGILAALAYPTFFYTRRAFVELWHHGYTCPTKFAQPELNILVRLFMTDPGANAPVDLARIELNILLRFFTVVIVFLLSLVTAGIASEMIVTERSRETWNSLIATSLSARDLLRSKVLACLWRLRVPFAILFILWSIGLAAGAVHPAGYLLTLAALAGWTWCLLALGLLISLRSKDLVTANNTNFGILFATIAAGLLPFLLPRWLSSVLWGVGSPPYVAWLSLLSYRDVYAAVHHSVYPLSWAGIDTGEGGLAVAAACSIGVLAPAFGGMWIWRYTLAHFDRLIGRPWRADRVGAGAPNKKTSGDGPPCGRPPEVTLSWEIPSRESARPLMFVNEFPQSI
jgi:hypothetical protein